MSIPFIHCTDLFHPPADSDDTWDLATAFALAQRGKVDLKGVVFDWLQEATAEACSWAGDPGVVTLGQMNYITGRSVPAAVGSSVALRGIDDAHADLPPIERAGANLILQILRESDQPVAIDIVGSCRDVALACNTNPDLFREKCRAVYVLAGTATTNPDEGWNSDYNLNLDRAAFCAMFHLPCPLYWTPGIGAIVSGNWAETLGPQRLCSHWMFRQSEILPHLSPIVQNYFAYGLAYEHSPRWLRYLNGKVDAEKMSAIGAQVRNMWSTAPMLHLAGLAVQRDGSLVPVGENPDNAVFGFRPILARTCQAGIESWQYNPGGTGRFICEVLDLGLYDRAMTTALRSLLGALGRQLPAATES